jgi:hypothetical protein
MAVMNKIQALNAFWNSFQLKAYDETSVPDGAELPYITYEVSSDDFGGTLAQVASLWYRNSSWSEITAKEQEIADFITRGGRMIAYDGGAMWIQMGTPWAQRMGDPSDELIRRIVLNIQIEFLD